jgi:2-oxoglutarate ferredoxin oxidoreductase subunit alpha
MTGLKVMTATSGPGISLYSEQISFAVGSEIPIVIVDVQRLGPSTGSATRGADGDINFLRWGNSGGLPVIVLAPVDVVDCFTLTVHAFNLAERFRCPVFIASNKEIGMTRESVDPNALQVPEIIDRRAPADGTPFLPFQIMEGRSVPDFLPIGADVPVRQTSSTHGASGYITTDHDEIAQILKRLKSKLETAVESFSYYESLEAAGSETLIIAYGVTARAAKAVFRQLQTADEPADLLILKTLWPMPENVIRRAAQKVGRIVVAEMNLGQYVREIERILPDKRIEFCGQMDGRLVTPDKLREAVIHG